MIYQILYRYRKNYNVILDVENDRFEDLYTEGDKESVFNELAIEGEFDDYVNLGKENVLKIGGLSYNIGYVMKNLLSPTDKRIWMDDFCNNLLEDLIDNYQGELRIHKYLDDDEDFKIIKKYRKFTFRNKRITNKLLTKIVREFIKKDVFKIKKHINNYYVTSLKENIQLKILKETDDKIVAYEL